MWRDTRRKFFAFGQREEIERENADILIFLFLIEIPKIEKKRRVLGKVKRD